MAHGQWTRLRRGVLSALAKSGLSIEKFVRDRGITPQRIYWWTKKLFPPKVRCSGLGEECAG